MKRKCAVFVIASLFVFAMLGSARAQSDEEQLKKLETDRAAAIVKAMLQLSRSKRQTTTP
jgi:hypothetical protein